MIALPAAAQEATPVDDEVSVEEAPSATPDEEAQAVRARELFGEGVEHAAAQRWARAIDAFESALELRAAPAILYNLAAALVESGRYRDAHGHLLALEADPETTENLANLGRELRVRIETEAARLRITRTPSLADTEVVLDTLPIPPEMLDTAIPVRAGEHRVVATRGAAMVATLTLMASPGELAEVLLEPAPTAPPLTEDPSTSIAEEPAFWFALGAGVLLVAGVLIVTAVVLSEPEQSIVPGDFTPGLVTWP